MLVFALAFPSYIYAVLGDINGTTLPTASNSDPSIYWPRLSFQDIRFNGVAVSNRLDCFATLISTWGGDYGTIPLTGPVLNSRAIAVTTMSCIQDIPSLKNNVDPNFDNSVIFGSVYSNVSVNSFYKYNNRNHQTTKGYSGINPPVFNAKYYFDYPSPATSQMTFNVTKILFATGNLTDLVVFDTGKTVAELTTKWISTCNDATYVGTNHCYPRFYSLPKSLPTVGTSVAYIVEYDSNNTPNKRISYGNIVYPSNQYIIRSTYKLLFDDAIATNASLVSLATPLFTTNYTLLGLGAVTDTTFNSGPSLVDLGACFDPTTLAFNLTINACMATWKLAQLNRYNLTYFGYIKPVPVFCDAKCNYVPRDMDSKLVKGYDIKSFTGLSDGVLSHVNSLQLNSTYIGSQGIAHLSRSFSMRVFDGLIFMAIFWICR